MRINQVVAITAKRWAASWWSIAAQVGTWIFYATMFVGLMVHRTEYERGLIPASLFQSADSGLWAISDRESAMTEWYVSVFYLGASLLVLPSSIWVCWRMRCVLQRPTVGTEGDS